MNTRAAIDMAVALAITSFGKSRAVIASISVPWLFFAAPQSQAADEPGPAYPRDGAFVRADNLRVTIWEVQREKGRRSMMYRLPLDQVTVTLTEGAVKFTRPDGTHCIEQLRVGTVRFESKGTVVQDEGLSDVPSREIVFQLKDFVPPSPGPKVPGIPGQFPRLDATKLFENERINVWDEIWLPNRTLPMHLHYADTFGVYIQEGQLRVRDVGQEPGPGRLRYVGYVRSPGEMTSLVRDVRDITEKQRTPLTPAETSGRTVPHEEDWVAGNPRAIWVEFKDGK